MNKYIPTSIFVFFICTGLLFASDGNPHTLSQEESIKESRCSQELISYVRMAGKSGSATGAVVSGLIARYGACGAVRILSQTR